MLALETCCPINQTMALGSSLPLDLVFEIRFDLEPRPLSHGRFALGSGLILFLKSGLPLNLVCEIRFALESSLPLDLVFEGNATMFISGPVGGGLCQAEWCRGVLRESRQADRRG